jgi:hypothetical protein
VKAEALKTATAAALLLALALLAVRWALEHAWRLRAGEAILAPSAHDVEDVISGAIRIAREAAAGE